jgi:hypothetical protein
LAHYLLKTLNKVEAIGMRRVNKSGAWGLYEWVITALLTMSATLLGICAGLMWSYFPLMASGSNSTSVSKYESRIEAALSSLQQQQALSNSALDGIRSELRDLNEKAGKAADVTPPGQPLVGGASTEGPR